MHTSNYTENSRRRNLLRSLEPLLSEYVFERKWREGDLTEQLVRSLRLVGAPTWQDFSNGTYSAQDAARNIRNSTFPQSREEQAEHLRELARNHENLPGDLIIAEDLDFTVLDGCSRAVALNLALLERKPIQIRRVFFGKKITEIH